MVDKKRKKKSPEILEIVQGEKDLASIKKEARIRGLKLRIRKSGKEGRSNIFIVRSIGPIIRKEKMPKSRMPAITSRIRKRL